MFTSMTFNGLLQPTTSFQPNQFNLESQCHYDQDNSPYSIRTSYTQPESFYTFLQKKSSSESLNQLTGLIHRKETFNTSSKAQWKESSTKKSKEPLRQISSNTLNNNNIPLSFEDILHNAINEKKQIQHAEKEMKKRNKVNSIKMHQRMLLANRDNDENISPDMEDW